MSRRESSLPTEWLAQGDIDLEAVEILLRESGPLPVVAFHLQQAAEKYLKGYLLSTGWPLRRIHDLEVLVREAIALDPDFGTFLIPCQRITEYYVEARYPTGVHSELPLPSLEDDLATTRRLVSLIRSKLGGT